MYYRVNRKAILFTTASAMALVLLPSEAGAQYANQNSVPASGVVQKVATAGDVLGDIVVTARRRKELLQDVPQAVSVITPAELKTQLVTNQNDLQSKIPSLSVAGRYGTTGGTYALRGLSSSNSGTPSVGTYFAEVPTPTNNLGYDASAGQSLYDLESVQVLKGPQGTLFGRSTTAGAVLVTPAAPDLQNVKANGNLAIGNMGYLQATLAVSVPIIDDVLALRVAGNYNHRRGYTKVIGTGQRLNELNNESQRVSLRFQPFSWFKNTTIYDRFHVDQAPTAFIPLSYNPNLPLFNPAVNAAFVTPVCNQLNGAGTPGAAACVAQRQAILATIKANLATEVARTAQGGDELRRVNAGRALTYIERSTHETVVNTTEITLPELGPLQTQVKNIFGYQTTNGVTALNVSGTPDEATNIYISVGAGLTGNQVGNQAVVSVGPGNKFYSNETQLSGSLLGDRLVFVGGYYYQHAPETVDRAGVGAVQKSFGGVTTRNLGFVAARQFTVGGRSNQSAWYTQGTVSFDGLVDNLKFTAGFRHTKDDFLLLTTPVVIDPVTGVMTPSAAPVVPQTLKTSGKNYNYSLDYKVMPNLLVYVARRVGYVPGGLNNPTGAGAPGFALQYGSERIKDVEAGFKWDFDFGGTRGRFNVAAYTAKYSNIQRSFTGINSAGASTTYVTNGANAKLSGIEGELTIVPTDNLTIGANYSYNKTKYTTWTGADPYGGTPGVIDLSNNPFPNAPRHKASFRATYDIPLSGDNGTVSISGQYSYQTRVYYGLSASERYIQLFGEVVRDAISQKGYGLANANIAWQDVLGHQGVTASLFARNLFDKIYKVSTNSANHNLGHTAAIYGEPRIVGVGLGFQY